MGIVKESSSTTNPYSVNVANKSISSISRNTIKGIKVPPTESFYQSLEGNMGTIRSNQVVKFPTNTVNETDLTYKELTTILQKALKVAENLNEATGQQGYTSPNESNEMLRQKLKEVENNMIKAQKKFDLYKYYSFVWIFSVLLLGFFVVMLILGILSVFSSISGIIAVIVGIIGGYLDWKEKERKYAS